MWWRVYCVCQLSSVVADLILLSLSIDAGASDAADWAIARSLSALRSAEARGELSQPAKDGSAPDEATGSVGESDSKGDRSV